MIFSFSEAAFIADVCTRELFLNFSTTLLGEGSASSASFLECICCSKICFSRFTAASFASLAFSKASLYSLAFFADRCLIHSDKSSFAEALSDCSTLALRNAMSSVALLAILFASVTVVAEDAPAAAAFCAVIAFVAAFATLSHALTSK